MVVVTMGIRVFWLSEVGHRQRLYYIRIASFLLALCVFVDAFLVFWTNAWLNSDSFIISSLGFSFFVCGVCLQVTHATVASYYDMQGKEQEKERFTGLGGDNKAVSVYTISEAFDTKLKLLLQGLRQLMTTHVSPVKNKREWRQEMEIATLALEKLIRDSDQLKLLEAKTYVATSRVIVLSEFLQCTVQRALKATKQSHERLKLNLDANTEAMLSDTELLSTVLYHLLENALLYTDGKVECSTQRLPSSLRFEIIDQGPGITNQQKKYIFQKFSRNVNYNNQISGLGLGLYLVSLVIKALKGKLEFHNNHGSFSKFVVTVPVQSV